MIRTHRQNNRLMFKSEINIIPLLDVLLVLLLIFMTTTPTTTQSIVVNLPYATESETVSINNNQLVIIEVSGIGQYSIIIDKNRVDQLSSQQIITKVQNLVRLNPKITFLIGGLKDIPYNEIIKILNTLSSAGVKSVGLMTQPV